MPKILPGDHFAAQMAIPASFLFTWHTGCCVIPSSLSGSFGDYVGRDVIQTQAVEDAKAKGPPPPTSDRPRPEGGHAIPPPSWNGRRATKGAEMATHLSYSTLFSLLFKRRTFRQTRAGGQTVRQPVAAPRPRPRSRRNSVLFFAPSSEKNAGGEKKEGTKEELSLPVSRESVTTSQSVSQSASSPTKRLFTDPTLMLTSA